MHIDYWAATDVGKQRDHNEDNYLVDKNLRLFVVADGMGGHAAGEVASSMCVRRVRDAIAGQRSLVEQAAKDSPAHREKILRLLEEAIHQACAAIFQRAKRQTEKRGMGTTCSLLLLAGDRGYLAHVGDSRIYLLRQGQIHQLSEDHSIINELIRRGRVKAEEVENSPYWQYKNAVTRAVGVYESVEVDTLDFDVLPEDRFLLCTDGLHHYLELDRDKIFELTDLPDSEAVTSALIDFANKGGGHDNVTNVFIRVGESEEGAARARDVTLKLETLRNVPLFRYLTYKELVRLLNLTTVHDFEDQEPIIAENEPAEDMYVILEGAVRLHKGASFITLLEKGAHFGEMALIDSSPRSASGTVQGMARVLAIHRRDFFDIIRDDSRLSTKLLWCFVQVLAERLRKTTADLSGARMEASLPDLTEEILADD